MALKWPIMYWCAIKKMLTQTHSLTVLYCAPGEQRMIGSAFLSWSLMCAQSRDKKRTTELSCDAYCREPHKCDAGDAE